MSQEGQSASAYLSWLLQSLCSINIMRHVDVDGIRPESGLPSTSPQYMQMVDRARQLVRSLEASTQALYDDGMTIFMAVQLLGRAPYIPQRERTTLMATVESTAPTVRSNCVLVAQTLESLLAIGHDQASISQGDYRNSIEWRTSRINMADSSIAAISRMADIPAGDDEFIDMEAAFAQPTMRTAPSLDTAASTLYSNTNQQPSQSSLDMSDRSRSESVSEPETPTWQTDTAEGTLVGPPSPDMPSPLDDDAVAFVDEDDRECYRLDLECPCI